MSERSEFSEFAVNVNFSALKNLKSVTNLEDTDEVKKLITKKKIEYPLSKETDKTIELIKTLSNELLNLVKLEENLARTINYMSGALYNQLKDEKYKLKESKLNEFFTYIQAEKILLDNIDELRENMYNYNYKIKRKLREIKEKTK